MDLSLYGGLDPRHLPAYTMEAVAHHAGVPLPTLKSWVKGRSYPVQGGFNRFERIISPPNDDTPMLSFTNLVEVHVLSAIRRKHSVALPKVRTALDYLREQFQSEHPLAEYVFQTNGVDLFVELLGEIVNASQGGQLGMRAMLEAHLQRIERDVNHNALRLYPFLNFAQPNAPKYIVIDPFVSFGRPVINGTGIATSVVLSRFNGGDTIQKLASDYRRSGIEIEEAIRFEGERLAA
jgi:uncharacterized protein (DUF433 family)